jgi:hypothetical protein
LAFVEEGVHAINDGSANTEAAGKGVSLAGGCHALSHMADMALGVCKRETLGESDAELMVATIRA